MADRDGGDAEVRGSGGEDAGAGDTGANGGDPKDRDPKGRDPKGRDPKADDGRDGGPRESTGRARPTSQRDRAGTGRRRPSTARRSGPGGRLFTGRAVQVQRLLGLSSTRRAAVLALVVCALVLSIAVPLRNYLAQRGELDETVRQQEMLREQVDGLEDRKAQLLDPTQIEVEARNRLRYVRPGETPYVVQLPSSQPPAPPPADAPRSSDGDRWYGEMWKSVTGPSGAGE